MRRTFIGSASALALVLGLSATQADAQGFRRFRVEADTGISSWHSEGASKSKWGWGAAAGADFNLGGLRSRCRGHVLARSCGQSSRSAKRWRCQPQDVPGMGYRSSRWCRTRSRHAGLRQVRLRHERAAQGVRALRSGPVAERISAALRPRAITTTTATSTVTCGVPALSKISATCST